MDAETETSHREPDKLLSSIERLTDLTMRKLVDGSRDKLLDASQHRLLTVLALRCIKLWRELRKENQSSRKPLEKELEQLEASTKDQE